MGAQTCAKGYKEFRTSGYENLLLWFPKTMKRYPDRKAVDESTPERDERIGRRVSFIQR
jgi:hypothetical protein